MGVEGQILAGAGQVPHGVDDQPARATLTNPEFDTPYPVFGLQAGVDVGADLDELHDDPLVGDARGDTATS